MCLSEPSNEMGEVFFLFCVTQTAITPLRWSRTVSLSLGPTSFWPFPTSPWSQLWRTSSRHWTKSWSALSVSPRGWGSGVVSCHPRWVWDEWITSPENCWSLRWDRAKISPFTLQRKMHERKMAAQQNQDSDSDTEMGQGEPSGECSFSKFLLVTNKK